MCMTNACPARKQQQHILPCIGTSNAIHLARQQAHLKACKLESAILEASPQELLPPRQVHALSDCFHGVRGGVVIIICVSTCSIGNLQSRLHSTGQTVTWCMADRAHFCVEVMQLCITSGCYLANAVAVGSNLLQSWQQQQPFQELVVHKAQHVCLHICGLTNSHISD